MTIRTGWAKWRSATVAEWEDEDPVVPFRTVAVAIDTHRLKAGDGTSTWSELPYLEQAEVEVAVAAAVAALVDAAPGALDTLNELAAALADDPSFATTITTALATKATTAALSTETTNRIAGDAASVATAATDATTKANAAQAAATSAAATDATTKANAAQAAATSAAATDATTKANAAQAAATSAAATDATTKASAAQSAATTAAAADATAKVAAEATARATAITSATAAEVTRANAAYVPFAKLAENPELLIVGVITRSGTDAATSAPVVWPDGATGTYTGTESATVSGAIDSYTVTHVLGGTTITYTQPTVTRNATGAVTTKPAITVA